MTLTISAVGYGGDSVDFGSAGITGGYRKGVENALIGYPGYSSSGPYDNGASPGMVYTTHYTKPGQTALQALTDAGGIAANVTTYGWDCLVMGWGINDVFQERPTVDILATYASIYAAARTARPGIRLVQRSMVCEGCAYSSQTTALNTGLRALALASRVIFVDVGTPHTSDTKHPVDGATGYDLMAAAIAPAILLAFTPYALFTPPAPERTFTALDPLRTIYAPAPTRTFVITE